MKDIIFDDFNDKKCKVNYIINGKIFYAKGVVKVLNKFIKINENINPIIVDKDYVINMIIITNE